jgi:hypothetical protein
MKKIAILIGCMLVAVGLYLQAQNASDIEKNSRIRTAARTGNANDANDKDPQVCRFGR